MGEFINRTGRAPRSIPTCMLALSTKAFAFRPSVRLTYIASLARSAVAGYLALACLLAAAATCYRKARFLCQANSDDEPRLSVRPSVRPSELTPA